MKMLVCVVLSSLTFFSFSAASQIHEEKMAWKELRKQGKATKTSGLLAQKKDEMEKKWASCAQRIKANQNQYPSLKGWILISGLRCARELSLEKKTSDALKAAVKSLESSPELLVAGPWKSTLWAESIKSRLVLLDLLVKEKEKLPEAWKQVEILLEMKDHLDRAQKARVLAAAGELAQQKAELRAAEFLYQQSLIEQESRATREKLNSLLFALNEKKEEEKPKAVPAPEPEGNFEERFAGSQKSNDLMALMEDCVAYLHQFPGGRRAKWAQDKIIEIYFNLSESQSDEKFASLKERSLGLMEKVDAYRQLEWVRQLHRRGDYKTCLRISEKALQSLGLTANGSSLLYLGGRCAQFSGEYNSAKKHFEKYIQQFAGGDEISEVYFRLGLVHLRLGQASSAIAAFEKVLLSKNSDRYELNSKYWLVRSMQATNNPRAIAMADDVLSSYPLSYYGLRLRAERSAGVLEWPGPLKSGQELKGSYFLTNAQKKSLARAELLAQHGWTAEALLEVSEIPVPINANVKVLLAKKLSQLELFPPVVRLVNEAGDLNPELRSLDVITLSLPQIYKEAIAEQATKQKLSPYLVRSLIRQESAFGPKAISSSNAYGLMQIIGPTAQEISSELGLKSLLIPEDVFVPENNIQMGTYYIAKMIKQFGGNVPLGLAAYNAGPHRMKIFAEARQEVFQQTQKFSSDPWDEMWFDEIPWSETSFYVKAILRNSILYQLAERAELKNPDQRQVRIEPVLWSHLVSSNKEDQRQTER